MTTDKNKITSINSTKKAMDFLTTIDESKLSEKNSTGKSKLHQILLHIFDYDLLGYDQKVLEKGLKYISDKAIKKEIMNNANENNILISIIKKRSSSILLKHILKDLDDELIQSKGFQYVLNYENWGLIKKQNFHDSVEWYSLDFIKHFHDLIANNPKTEHQADKLYLNYFIQSVQESRHNLPDKDITRVLFQKMQEKTITFKDINNLSLNILQTETPKNQKFKDFLDFYTLLEKNLSSEEKKHFEPWHQEIKKSNDQNYLYNLRHNLLKENTGISSQDFITLYYSKVKEFIQENKLELSYDYLNHLKISKRFITDNFILTETKTDQNIHQIFNGYSSLLPVSLENSFNGRDLIKAASIFTEITSVDLTEILKEHFIKNYPSDKNFEDSILLSDKLHTELLNKKAKPTLK